MQCLVYNYANDTQLILHLDDSVRAREQACDILRFITSWMGHNALKLNPDKTELLIFGKQADVWSELFWPLEMGSPPDPSTVGEELGLDY